ncbi:MAG: TetM/TetW/TetO/TetS family tetracycline resistance ribosomal protection protein [bacterium]|nr:TetM/TetW/TetO/TetS family tetracycline resistance ribosomal protection protein [bacterium]
MKKLVIGILAHVDAGKTTLSESMLYLSGAIRKLGRVDNKDAFLDTNELERARGITIFSKQAMFQVEDTLITLLDTPGHVDFSAEMERTLQVLDYAILVVSGADGVQGHTKTLWRLLKMYDIPVFLFINKMDQNGTDKELIIEELKQQLDDGCIDFDKAGSEEFYDQIAMSDEDLLEEFLESGEVGKDKIKMAIQQRKVFPCYFGSALKLTGVEEFMKGMVENTVTPVYHQDFGAKVFKIARDETGARLTYMKITGGTLKVKSPLTNKHAAILGSLEQRKEEIWEEKVNQIRIYSGEKFEAVNEIEAGSVCAVSGLTKTYPGEGLGSEAQSSLPLLEPVLSYQILLPEGCDARAMLPKLRQLEEEGPELHIVWDETLQEIQVQIMGEVQIEILKSMILERFGIEVDFGAGNIVYKETIVNTVEGVGHFEPLRHYAEVHLLMEPGERGSGLTFGTDCSEDVLGRNWQRLVLTHLEEKEHRGVLTGSYITDMKITLVSGRAHNKHTEGGDFREATYRAVRQGLKQAESILLEPYYEFSLELPEKMVGRAMTDIEKMHGTCELTQSEGEFSILTGSAPVVTMKNYHQEVLAYTKGHGRLFCSLKGYEPCHNQEEVIEAFGYDSERDIENPTGSVFCAHGSGFLVPWDDVYKHMHLELSLNQNKQDSFENMSVKGASASHEEWIDIEEIDQILNRATNANSGSKSAWKKSDVIRRSYAAPVKTSVKARPPQEQYLLVDGYNVIFTWEELNELAKVSIDGARGRLMDYLCDYQGVKKCNLIVVFDAYRIEGHPTEIYDYHNIHVVYTKEAETADQYIEKFVHQNASRYQVTVATSDGLEQIIIRGAGSALLSARDLKNEIERTRKEAIQAFEEKKEIKRNHLYDALSEEGKQAIEQHLNQSEH